MGIQRKEMEIKEKNKTSKKSMGNHRKAKGIKEKRRKSRNGNQSKAYQRKAQEIK